MCTKLKHWCGFSGKSSRRTASILMFCGLVGCGQPGLAPAQPLDVPEVHIRLLIDVLHDGIRVKRDEIRASPLEPYYREIVLANDQPAILRCESRIVTRQSVRTSCQILSGDVQSAFTKIRWTESRIGKDDRMLFQDRQSRLVEISIRPTRFEYSRPRSI